MFDLSGLTDNQRRIIQEALDACNFPFQELNRTIPVEFADLSRYAAVLDEAEEGHAHIHEDGDTGHPIERVIEGRRRVLGLAWYSGKVSVDSSLEQDEPLAQEVFLAEGAHMVDFFYMTEDHRKKLYAVYHDGDERPHDHGWFEETGNQDYWSWVGESFMGGFIRAYAPTVPVTLDNFIHKSPPEIGPKIREVLTPGPIVYGLRRSSVYHDKHDGVAAEVTFPSKTAAESEGRRPCRVCKPERN